MKMVILPNNKICIQQEKLSNMHLNNLTNAIISTKVMELTEFNLFAKKKLSKIFK